MFVYGTSPYPDNSGSISLKEIKIEVGNKATDWTPAPEDVQEDCHQLGYPNYADLVAKATAGSTIISGGYINTSLIDADAIIAEMAYIGGLTIGENKLYLGAGNYANSNTPFYVDSTNHFSLGSKLTFDGADLVVNGGGTFSGALSAATGTFRAVLVQQVEFWVCRWDKDW